LHIHGFLPGKGRVQGEIAEVLSYKSRESRLVTRGVSKVGEAREEGMRLIRIPFPVCGSAVEDGIRRVWPNGIRKGAKGVTLPAHN